MNIILLFRLKFSIFLAKIDVLGFFYKKQKKAHRIDVLCIL